MQNLMSGVELYIQELNQHSQEVSNCQRKADVCEWWLEYIQDEVFSLSFSSFSFSFNRKIQVDKFLVEKGVVIDAVPEDYTETPPESMEVLNKNLKIIKSILNVEVNSQIIFNEKQYFPFLALHYLISPVLNSFFFFFKIFKLNPF